MSTDNADRYPHLPLSKRDPADQPAALSAFQRLYLHASQSGRTALAIFAVYKALQKLEEPSLPQVDDGEEVATSASTTAIPAWVRCGLWFAFETYLLRPAQPGVTDKKRSVGFQKALTDDWEDVRRWCLVKSFMLQHKKKLTLRRVNSLQRATVGTRCCALTKTSKNCFPRPTPKIS
jgi:hypothetical protein